MKLQEIVERQRAVQRDLLQAVPTIQRLVPEALFDHVLTIYEQDLQKKHGLSDKTAREVVEELKYDALLQKAQQDPEGRRARMALIHLANLSPFERELIFTSTYEGKVLPAMSNPIYLACVESGIPFPILGGNRLPELYR